MFSHLRKFFTIRSRAGRRLARRARGACGRRPRLEALEDRCLLSGAMPTYVLDHSAVPSPAGTFGPSGYSPAQIRHAYGIDQIQFGSVTGDGSGQTIAIIDAYDDPNVAADLHQFDLAFGLPDPPSFQKVAQNGSANYPTPDAGWATEISLDVEWAHALAPGAGILLVEAADNSFSNLFAAVNYAKQQPGVSVVSMSFSGDDFSGENSYDSVFTSPPGHGVTFLAATGDNGAPSGYPAVSPNVVAVGGTTLTLSGSNYVSETGWSGSGGGLSQFEAQPSYQQGVVTQSASLRAVPDVAFDADPNTGVPVYDSYGSGSPWLQVGGTSFATPSWAALVAIADQGRALQGLGSLDGPTQTLPLLYSLSSGDFHDITSGNNGYAAGPGYDLVTGRGTPVANKLVPDLAGFSARPLTYTAPASNGPNTIVLVISDGNIEVFDNNSLVALQAVSSTSSVTITGSPYVANQIYVQGTAQGIPTTINLETASDYVAVGSSSGAQAVLGTLTVQALGSIHPTLYVNDTGDLTGQNATITASGIAGLAPADINYAGIGTVVVTGDSQANAFAITGSPGVVQLYDGGSADSVAISVPAGAVYAYGRPGDVAYLFGTSGGNSLNADLAAATLSGQGYSETASGFGTINAYAATAADVAVFRGGTAGANRFVTYGSTYTYMSGSGILNVAYGFEHSYAYAATASDAAYFQGLPVGSNAFVGNGSTYAFMNGPGYSDVAYGFSQADAFAGSPSDLAYFYGSTSGRNNFVADGSTYTYMTGPGYTNVAYGFARSYAVAGTAADGAQFQGSAAGPNYFVGNGTAYAFMNGPGYSDVSYGFASAAAAAGTRADVAYLYDAAGTDVFQGQGASASLAGSGFTDNASGFSVVNLTATQAGVKQKQVGAIDYVLITSGDWQ